MAMASYGSPIFKTLFLDFLNLKYPFNLLRQNKYNLNDLNKYIKLYSTSFSKINELFKSRHRFHRTFKLVEIIIDLLIEKDSENRFHLAASLQSAVEDKFKEIVTPYITKYENVCFSGGFSLNSVLLGKIKKWFPNVKNIHCDPFPHDSGLSLGSAMYLWHHYLGNERTKWIDNFSPYLGVTYSKKKVTNSLKKFPKLKYKVIDMNRLVDLLDEQNIIAVFGGGAESGKRALGNRSIIADPRNKKILDRINNEIKHREWFRPVAPSILREDVKEWFEYDIDSPYMSFAIKFKKEMRDKVPCVVHVDGTGRLQTVTEKNTNGCIKMFFKNKIRLFVFL